MQNLKESIDSLGGDPYEILEADPSIDFKALRKNYRTLAAKYHPDKNKEEGAKLMFIKINQAYEFLQSESNRILYHSQINALAEQKKRMESMDAGRKKYADDLKERQMEFQQRQKDMEIQLKRRKQFYLRKMKEQEQRDNLKAQIITNLGSKKYYEEVASCDVKWEEGFSFTDKMLRIAFSPYGTVTDVNIETKRNRATITLNSIEDCSKLVNTFDHPLMSVSFHIEKQRRDKLLKVLKVDKNAKIDLSLNSENIARIKQIINRNSTLYHQDRKYVNID